MATPIQHKNVPRTTLARQQAPLHTSSLELNANLAEKVVSQQWYEDVEANTDAGAGVGAGAANPEKTVLYLAYGSNMDTRTFSKKRGIKPISLVNVYAPELELTFDLAGMPYREPCFATARYRRQHSRGDNPDSDSDTGDEKHTLLSDSNKKDTRGHWAKPLIGVVYEITVRDYAWMIATESGGRGYNDRIVTCHPFPDNYSPADEVPDHPSTAPFKAHTLLSLLADHDGHSPLPVNPRIRPDPAYAQPSRRYRDLVHSGAVESDLPFAYRDYLLGIHAFELTTARQRTGKSIFLALWTPVIAVVEYCTLVYRRPDGYSPNWVVVFASIVYTCLWKSYDWLFFRLFGDGERTISDSLESMLYK